MSGVATRRFPKLKYILTESGLLLGAARCSQQLDRIHMGVKAGAIGEMMYDDEDSSGS